MVSLDIERIRQLFPDGVTDLVFEAVGFDAIDSREWELAANQRLAALCSVDDAELGRVTRLYAEGYILDRMQEKEEECADPQISADEYNADDTDAMWRHRDLMEQSRG